MIDISKINSLISSTIKLLLENNRINEDYVNQFYKSFEQTTLQIGVVGKMKTGKSALVNAILFEDDVLPSSPEPVTVTLTKVSYGKENKSTVEFLSADDLNAIMALAAYSGDDETKNALKKNAQEIIDSLPKDGYSQYLGQTIDIPNNELDKYVASNGKFCGLVKVVNMEINNDNLKGITIIDTPGFNDPVASRGETTKNFLTECHIVLFVHNSDGYDQPDAELLNTQLEYAGISKLVDVFNKMDMKKSLALSDWDGRLERFIEVREDYLSKDKHPKVYALVKSSNAVAVSAFMALCGMRSKEKRSEFVKTQIAKFEERYPELTANEEISLEEALIKYSNIDKLISILNDIAANDKQYLKDKPIETLKGKLTEVIKMIYDEIELVKSELGLLKQNKQEALKDLENFTDFMNSIKKSISNTPLETVLSDEIDSTRSRIQQRREEEANSFTKQKYPEPGFLDTGVTKANISAYNVELSRFQSLLRGDLDSGENYSGLKEKFKDVTKQYINKIIKELINPKVSEAMRNNFRAQTINAANKQIANINVAIPAYSVTNIPDGNAEQWSLLRTDFLSHYCDTTIDSLLSKFKECSEEIGRPEYITYLLTKIEDDRMNELNKEPMQKKVAIKTAEEKIKALENELKWVNEQLEQLNKI